MHDTRMRFSRQQRAHLKVVGVDLSDYDPGGLHCSPFAQRRWISWHYGDRRRKTPNCKWTEPGNWVTRGELDGLAGFVLGRVPEERLVYYGIDIDGYYRDGKFTDARAQQIVDRFKTYAEVSPSGKGVKLFFALAWDDAHGLDNNRSIFNEGEHLGVSFDINRWYAVTGKVLDGDHWSWRQMSRADVDWLFRLGGTPTQKKRDDTRSADAYKFAIRFLRDGDDYDTVKQKMLESKGRVGDWSNSKGLENDGRELDRVIEAAEAALAPEGSPMRPSDKTKILPYKWIADARPIAMEWRVNGLLPKRGVGLLIGWRGAGKTWLALTLALFIAVARRFAERNPERCGVLYLAVDRPDQAIRRLQWLIRHYRIKDKDPAVIVCRECPILTRDDNALDVLLNTISAVDGETMKHKRFGVGVVIIDTLIMAAGWTDESSSSEVNKVIRILREVSERTDAVILLVDHTGKNRARGARGSSDKEASTDFVLAIDDINSCLVVDRVTDGPQGLRIPFYLQKHEVGHDAEGNATTECTVEWGDDPHAQRDVVREGVLMAMDELITSSLGGIVKHCKWQPEMKDRVRRAIEKLIDQRLVERDTASGRTTGFRITREGQTAAGVVRDREGEKT